MIGFDSLIDCLDIKNFSDALHNYLDMQNTELYSLDRIEDDIGILENRSTGEIIEVPSSQLEPDSKDGDIFKFFDGAFEKDDISKTNILNKINDLRESITTRYQ